MQAQSSNMRVIQAGWIVVVFMLCAAYTASMRLECCTILSVEEVSGAMGRRFHALQ